MYINGSLGFPGILLPMYHYRSVSIPQFLIHRLVATHRIYTGQQRSISKLPDELFPLIFALLLGYDPTKRLLLHMVHHLQDPAALQLSARGTIAQRSRRLGPICEKHVRKTCYRHAEIRLYAILPMLAQALA